MNENAASLSLPLNTAHRLREAIENDIVSGDFHPGERLDEASLATRFQVSRTPIREALQQLASAGMIEIRPRRGAIVALATPERLYEMFEVMAELEAMCARRAARRISEESSVALLLAHEGCASHLEDADAYYNENECFHQAVYQASGNAFLMEQVEAMQRRLRPYRRLQLRVRNRIRASFTEHETIVAAILAGDEDKAAQTMREHVRVQGERFSDLVASLARFKAA